MVEFDLFSHAGLPKLAGNVLVMYEPFSVQRFVMDGFTVFVLSNVVLPVVVEGRSLWVGRH
jgi:hypothetical protein